MSILVAAVLGLGLSSMPPTGPTCTRTGAPLYEVHVRDLWTASVYSSGAWSYVAVKPNGVIDRQVDGCFDVVTMRTIRALARAPWRTGRSPSKKCMPNGEDTEYRVNGTLRWSERACGLVAIDDATARSIAEVDRILKQAASSLPP